MNKQNIKKFRNAEDAFLELENACSQMYFKRYDNKYKENLQKIKFNEIPEWYHEKFKKDRESLKELKKLEETELDEKERESYCRYHISVENVIEVYQKEQKYFSVAYEAAKRLQDIPKETLKMLEKKEIIHYSTVSGGSLDCALNVLRKYFKKQERKFTGDEYEQLRRTCGSLANLLEGD